MPSNQTWIASKLITKATELSNAEGNRGMVDLLLASALALEELVAITKQIAPHGADARFDAWCQTNTNKECPSDHHEQYHISHI